MKPWLVLFALVACACPSKPTSAPLTTGSGSEVGAGSAEAPVTATTCDGVRPRIEAMYRAEAQQKEPNRVDEAVADNTKMVMTDCAKDPAKFVPCLAKAQSVAELEKECLVPLDEEGTEGEAKHP